MQQKEFDIPSIPMFGGLGRKNGTSMRECSFHSIPSQKWEEHSFLFFFFLISKKDVYSRSYFMHEKHKANKKYREKENKTEN